MENFNDRAKDWDSQKRIYRANIVSREIVNSIDCSNTFSAMEFGCGTGLISFNIYDKFKELTLIDSSEGMIDVVKSKISELNINNMTPLHLDLTAENSLDKKFDVIYTSMALHHIKDTVGIIKIFYDLLNEGGYLRIVDLDEDDGSFHANSPEFDGHDGFDQNSLKDILSSAGFKDVKSGSFFYDEKIMDGKRTKYSLFLMKGKK